MLVLINYSTQCAAVHSIYLNESFLLSQHANPFFHLDIMKCIKTVHLIAQMVNCYRRDKKM